MTTVPVSPFRRYRKKSSLTKTFQREEATRISRNVDWLKELWNSSVECLESYDYTGPFHKNKRKELPKAPRKISDISETREAAAYFKNIFSGRNASTLNSFIYIDREIATLRTPKSRFSDGTSASASGRGGMDLLLKCGDHVCAGEVKIRRDSELFGALLQVMWYGSEIASENQITRIKNHYEINHVETDKIDLAIFSIEQSGLTKDQTRDVTLEISQEINRERSGFLRLGSIYIFENCGDEWGLVSN